VNITHCVYTRESGSSRRHRQGRGSCDFIVPEKGFLDVCGLRCGKKGVKRPWQANNFAEHEHVVALIKVNWEFLAIEKSQLPIVRHNLASNRAHKSRFYEGRNETCRVTFQRQIIRKDLRFAPLYFCNKTRILLNMWIIFIRLIFSHINPTIWEPKDLKISEHFVYYVSEEAFVYRFNFIV